MKAYFLFILLLSSISVSISAQSSYLDKNYGDEGIVSLETRGYPFFYYHVSLDSENRLYLSLDYEWWSNTDQDSSENIFKLNRLTPDGTLDERWLYETQDTNASPYYFYYTNNLTWQQEDKLINYSSIQENGDTLPTTRILSLEGELLHTFEVSPIQSFAALIGNQYLAIDEQDRITVPTSGNLSRYLENGEIDLSYGIDGTTEVFTAENYLDSFYIIWLSLIYKAPDNSILFSTGSLNSDSTSFNSHLAKVSQDGQLDKAFGDDGFLNFQYSGFVNAVYFPEKDKYKIHYSRLDTSNNRYTSHVRKTDLNGQTELDFPIDNFRNPKNDSLHTFIGRFMEGPDGYSACITNYFTLNSADSTTTEYNYYMHRYLPNGKMDLSFGEEGFLSLDSIPGKYLYYNLLDQDYNAYFVTYDSLSLEHIENNAHVIKFKASALWPTVSDLPENTFKFDIYPNPSVDKFQMRYEGSILESINVSIFDMQGRLISTRDIPELRNKDEITLGNNFLSAGTYLIKVKDKENRNLYTDKVLIIK